MGWYGWDQRTALLLDIRNLLASKGQLHPPPTTSADAPVVASEADYLRQLRMRR